MSEFKYVPVEPTDEMLNQGADAASNVLGSGQTIISKHRINAAYKAMLAAAPEQPSPAESDKEAVRNATITNEQPKVPSNICQLIEAYGDARADHDIFSPALCELLTALREWGASLKTTSASEASQPAQPSEGDNT